MNDLCLSYIKQGLVVGLAISAPVGPTSIFCLQNSLTKGIASGLISSMGAATATTLQAAVGVFSLNLVISSLFDYRGWFNLMSGVFLCCLGIKIFASSFSFQTTKTQSLLKRRNSKNTFLKDYGAALLLTGVNPLNILPFVAFFTQMYSTKNHFDSIWAGVFVLGVFISSISWHGLIWTAINLFSKRILLRRLHWVNRISGIAIAVFGCTSIYSAWK